MVSLLGIDPANQLVRPSLVGHVRPESCTVAVWSLTYLKFLFCGCSSTRGQTSPLISDRSSSSPLLPFGFPCLGGEGRRGRGGWGGGEWGEGYYLLLPVVPCHHLLSPVAARCHSLSPVVTRYYPLSPVLTRRHRCQPSSTDVIRRDPSNPSSSPFPLTLPPPLSSYIP